MSGVNLPDKPNKDDIIALRNEKGISLQEARSILLAKYKEDVKAELLTAVYNLRYGIGDPADAEDTMLDILTVLIERM